MAINKENYQEIGEFLKQRGVTLVAVSKTKSVQDILELYELGHRDFGENYVQELVEKYESLPKDIRWHFIGHLQSNKVKHIAPFVHLIHGVDRASVLKEITKQAGRFERRLSCLLQVHIAKEDTKFGFSADELPEVLNNIHSSEKVSIQGLMGMATFTEEEQILRSEFSGLKSLFDEYFPEKEDAILSMGMSGDYKVAVEEGSNLVRIGSLLFGSRE